MPVAPAPANTTIHIQLMPEMKNRPAQTRQISIVWPKSGWATNSAATMPSSSSEKLRPGRSGRFCPSASRKPTRMANIGFMNSDGCTDMPRMVIQRREPLTSGPISSVRINRPTQTMKPASAART